MGRRKQSVLPSFRLRFRALRRNSSWKAKSQLLYINVQRFRGGLVLKARRLSYHPTLGLRVIKKRRNEIPIMVLSSRSVARVRFFFEYQYTWRYMTLGRCPLSTFCSRGTPPRADQP